MYRNLANFLKFWVKIMAIENPKKYTWILALSIFHLSFLSISEFKSAKINVVFGDFQ
jgi:hypothetical protein